MGRDGYRARAAAAALRYETKQARLMKALPDERGGPQARKPPGERVLPGMKVDATEERARKRREALEREKRELANRRA